MSRLFTAQNQACLGAKLCANGTPSFDPQHNTSSATSTLLVLITRSWASDSVEKGRETHRYRASQRLVKVNVDVNVRYGSRLCENYFLETETKYRFMMQAFAATMIRPRYLPDSIVAQLVSMSTFSHSLGQKRTKHQPEKCPLWGVNRS